MNKAQFIERFEMLNEAEKDLFQQLFYSEKEAATNSLEEKKHLVAYVTGNKVDKDAIKKYLGGRLPSHMVPHHIVILDELPKLPNGKVDNLKLKQYTPAPNIQQSKNETLDATTEKLKKIWQEVLQIESIGINDNFFEYGGDSILAIRIVSKARNEGIDLSPSIFMEKQTIKDIVSTLKTENNYYEESSSGELLPIQAWFFEAQGYNPYWHLGLKIELTPNALHHIKDGLKHLINNNNVLKTSFVQNENEISMVCNPSAEFVFGEVSIPTTIESESESLRRALIELHRPMDLEKGILVSALLVKGPINTLYLSFHHLVVDPISIILLYEELTNIIAALQQNKLPNKPSLNSIHYYSVVQTLAKNNYRDELPFWQDQCKQFEPLIRSENKPIYQSNTSTINYSTSSELTQILHHACEKFEWIKNDLLFPAALINAIAKWAGKSEIVIGVESSLRKLKELDAMNTIGWMTTYYPLHIKVNSQKPEQTYFELEHQLEKVKHNGYGYGMLRYKEKEESLAIAPDVLINYIGKLNTLENDTLGKAMFNKLGLRSDKSLFNFLLEFNILQLEEEFEISCTHVPELIDEIIVNNILDETSNMLKFMVDEHAKILCNAKQEYSLENIGMDDNDLNEILNQL